MRGVCKIENKLTAIGFALNFFPQMSFDSSTYTMNYLTPVPARGDFASEHCISEHSREMLTDGYRAVDSAPNGWAVLARSDVPGKDGFMFSTFNDPLVKETMNTINKNIFSGHSGASYGWTMRNMESIAKDGWDHLIYAFRLSHLEDCLNDRTTATSYKHSLAATQVKLERMKKDAKDAHKKSLFTPAPSIATVLQRAATVDAFLTSAAAQNAATDPVAFVNAARNDPGLRAQIPDIDQQADAITRFSEGKMSYAEMRSLCG